MGSQNTPFYGWKLTGVFFALYFLNASFPYYGGSVINTYMVLDLDMERSTLGMGFTVFILSMGLSAPLVGKLIVGIGVRPTLVAGGLVLSLATGLMGLVATEAWHYLLFFGGFAGLGFGLGGLLPIQAGITFWFRRRKALAMSIVMSATGFGTFLAAPLLGEVITANDDNWRLGWLLVAGTGLLAALIAAIGVRETPQALGQFPDGIDPSALPAIGSAGFERAEPVYQTREHWEGAEAIRTRAFWLLILAHVGFLVPNTTCFAHSVIHLKDLGHPGEVAALSIGLTVAFSVVGRLLGGVLCDRIEPRLIWSAALLVVALAIATLARASEVWQVVLYTLLMGLGFGCAMVCLPTMTGNYFGVESFPAVAGLMMPIATVLGSFAPTAAGMVYDSGGSYEPAFFATVGVALLAALLIPLARPPLKPRAAAG
jgi:MFS family permease